LSKPFSILPLILTFSLSAQPSYIDSLRKALTDPPGVELTFEMYQTMQGETWTGSGEIEIVGTNRYLASIGDQEIKVEGNDVQTWNKTSSQLIKDTLYQGNVNIISLLNDDGNVLKILDQMIENSQIIIRFSVPEMDARGTIIMNEISFLPIKIILVNGPETQTVMSIVKTQSIGLRSKFHSFNPDAKETIDLRE